MTNKSLVRLKVRVQITNWFKIFHPGETISTDDVVQRVHNYVSKTIDSGTIRRELRFLRDDGLINYRHVGQKKNKVIEIL